jgi:hypothetical protein
MTFLADLAGAVGSTELEYTDVHGICDVAHTEGLLRALEAEMRTGVPDLDADLFEGVHLLSELIRRIINPKASPDISNNPIQAKSLTDKSSALSGQATACSLEQ